MMDISLEIQTTDPTALLIAIAGVVPARGAEVLITDDTSLRYLGTESYRGADATAVVLFALSFPVGIATNVISTLVTDYLRRKRTDSALVYQARLVIRETEQVGTEGNRTLTRSTTYQTIPDKM